MAHEISENFPPKLIILYSRTLHSTWQSQLTTSAMKRGRQKLNKQPSVMRTAVNCFSEQQQVVGETEERRLTNSTMDSETFWMQKLSHTTCIIILHP